MSQEDNANTRTAYQMLLVAKVEELLKEVEIEDLVMISARGAATQYMKPGEGKSMKSVGGKGPVDYTAVETLQDLRQEMKKLVTGQPVDYPHMMKCYLFLHKVLKL